jgi:hypothetical protein
VGAVLEVDDLVRMLDAKPLDQRQLANRMPVWIAGGGAERLGLNGAANGLETGQATDADE